MSSKRIAVIGSGISGIAASLRLKSAGYEVDVFEKQSYLGGKIHTVAQDGFKWDAGPSFLTQPERIEELFGLFDERIQEYIDVQPVNPSVTYYWEDRMKIKTPQRQLELIEQFSLLGASPEQTEAYLDRIAHIYQSVGELFTNNNIFGADFWLQPGTIGRLFQNSTVAGQSLHRFNQSYFRNQPRIVQLLDRYATYAGADPYRASAFLASIADVELNQGIFYPASGMQAVADELITLGTRHGVRYHVNSEVLDIQTGSDSVTLFVNNEQHRFDQVLSSIDPLVTYRALGRNVHVPSDRSMSAILFFWGAESSQKLDLHTILFSDDYHAEFKAIANNTMPSNPTIYVNNTSAVDAEHAPDGMQNWFVMINTPPDSGQDWSTIVADQKQKILTRFRNQFDHPINIVSEKVYSPVDIERTSGAIGGSIYGPSANSLFALGRKQPYVDRRYPNLFFCGGSSHPGGGIPMCLSSAKIVSDIMASNTR